MARILTMERRHLDEVRDVDHRVWTHYYQSIHGTSHSPPRTAVNIRWNWEGDSEGCFIAHEGKRIVGYIFSHTWGAVGWLGVFGVLPDCRGRGVGKALLAAGVDYLRRAACATIGLETMPNEVHNLGLYMKAGFRPISHAFLLTKPVTGAPHPSAAALTLWEHLAPDERAVAMQAVSAISSAVVLGLDHRKTAETLAVNNLGAVALIGREAWTGFAAISTTSKMEGTAADTAVVKALCLLPGAETFFPEIAGALESIAARHDLAKLGLWLSGDRWDAVQALLSAGYRVAHVRLRMALVQGAEMRGGLEASTWAM